MYGRWYYGSLLHSSISISVHLDKRRNNELFYQNRSSEHALAAAVLETQYQSQLFGPTWTCPLRLGPFCLAVFVCHSTEKRECHRKCDFVNGSKFRNGCKRVQRLVGCPAAYAIAQLSYFSKLSYHSPKKKDILYIATARSPQLIPPSWYQKHLPTPLNASDQPCLPECPDVIWFALCWLETVSRCFSYWVDSSK